MSEHRAPILIGCLLIAAALIGCSDGGTADGTAALSPQAAQGQRIVETEGCASCHGADGSGVVGPAWTGLVGSEVDLESGATVLADDAYLLRAILDPQADVRTGFTLAMPANSLSTEDAHAVLAYLKELP